MSGVLRLASDDLFNDLLGCFGLEKEWVSVYLCYLGKGVVDVIEGRGESAT